MGLSRPDFRGVLLRVPAVGGLLWLDLQTTRRPDDCPWKSGSSPTPAARRGVEAEAGEPASRPASARPTLSRNGARFRRARGLRDTSGRDYPARRLQFQDSARLGHGWDDLEAKPCPTLTGHAANRPRNESCGRLMEDSPHNEEAAQGRKTLSHLVTRLGIEPRTY